MTVGLPTSVAVKTAPSGRGPIVVVLPVRTPPACTTMVGSAARGAGAGAVVVGALSTDGAAVVVVPADGLVVVVSEDGLVVVVSAEAVVADVVEVVVGEATPPWC